MGSVCACGARRGTGIREKAWLWIGIGMVVRASGWRPGSVASRIVASAGASSRAWPPRTGCNRPRVDLRPMWKGLGSSFALLLALICRTPLPAFRCFDTGDAGLLAGELLTPRPRRTARKEPVPRNFVGDSPTAWSGCRFTIKEGGRKD